jgi:hypothetical protein
MALPITQISPYTSVFSFIIGFPTLVGAYYQSWKAREEAKQAREGTLHSRDCLEFVSGDGNCINLVPLDTMPDLPRVGDVIFLPGHGTGADEEFHTGAYLVERVEQFYAPAEHKGRRPNEARLAKAVVQVTSLHVAFGNRLERLDSEDATKGTGGGP